MDISYAYLAGAGAIGMFLGWKLKQFFSPPIGLTDHYSIRVTDQAAMERAVKMLEPLGGKALYRIGECAIGMGRTPPASDVWLTCAPVGGEEPIEDTGPITPGHFAFMTWNRAQVDEWYDNALKLGFVDHGKPGIRPYHPAYYAAFVKCPETGHNYEAVCHIPVFMGMPKGRGHAHKVAVKMD